MNIKRKARQTFVVDISINTNKYLSLINTKNLEQIFTLALDISLTYLLINKIYMEQI
jgi:hypothetical protein